MQSQVQNPHRAQMGNHQGLVRGEAWGRSEHCSSIKRGGKKSISQHSPLCIPMKCVCIDAWIRGFIMPLTPFYKEWCLLKGRMKGRCGIWGTLCASSVVSTPFVCVQDWHEPEASHVKSQNHLMRSPKCISHSIFFNF